MATTDAGTHDPAQTHRLSRASRDQVIAWIAAVAAALPAVVAVITRWGTSTILVQDAAVMNLRVRDVLSMDTPLAGVYSQFGWNHPGPVVYWLLAPFSWLSGGAAWGLVVGTAAIQLIVVALTCFITWREGSSRWVVFWSAVLVLSYGATGPWMLAQVWNPHIAFPFFVLFLCVTWRAVVRPGSYLVWLIGCGSVLVQLHIGYTPLVLVLGVGVAVVVVRAVRSGAAIKHVRRTTWAGASVLAVLWALPFVDAVTHRGGNLRLLFNYFVLGHGAEQRAGLRETLGVAASQFRVLPPWLGGQADIDPLTGLAQRSSIWWLVIPAIAVATGVACYRRASLPVRGTLLVAWGGNAAGLAAIILVRGKLAPYLFYWQIPLAVILVASTALAIVQVLLRPRARLTAWAMSVVAVVLLLPSIQLAVDLVRTRGDVGVFERATSELATPLRSTRDPILIRWVGSPLGGLQAGLLNELEQSGVPVRVDEGSGFQFGRHREVPESDASQVLYTSEQGFVTAYLTSLRGSRVIAATSPLTRREEHELRTLQLEAIRQLADHGENAVIDKLDSPLVVLDLERVGALNLQQRRRLGELNEKAQGGGCRCAVVAFSPGDVPKELGAGIVPSQSGP